MQVLRSVFILIVLALAVILSGCGSPSRRIASTPATPVRPAPPVVSGGLVPGAGMEMQVTPEAPATTEPPAAAPPAATEPAVTEPPAATVPPATEPPATEPTATVAPAATEPPVATEPPATEPVATAPPAAVPPATSGDPEAGKALFNQPVFQSSGGFASGCYTCHYVEASRGNFTGPNLAGVGSRAATTVSGQSAEEYLHTSIVKPNEYVVQGFVAGLMPQNYGEVLTEEQINNLVAYLLTLQ